MKYKITYHEIQSDHILAVPEAVNSEIVEADSLSKIDKHICSKKDWNGNNYRRASATDKKMFGFDYISSTGGVKVKKYRFAKVKKL